MEEVNGILGFKERKGGTWDKYIYVNKNFYDF